MNDLFKTIGWRRGVKIAILIFILGGLGGIFFERAVLPVVSDWPLLNRMDFLTAGSPIVINRREEVRIFEGINQANVVNRAKDSLVSVYSHGGEAGTESFSAGNFVPGVIVTSDGVIMTAAEGIDVRRGITAGLSGGRFFPAEVLDTDELTGIAFLKIDAADLPVLGQMQTGELSSGQQLLVLQKRIRDESAAVLSASALDPASRRAPAGGVQRINALNAEILLSREMGADFRGAVAVDDSGNMAGFVSQIGGEAVVVRTGEIKLALDKLLSMGKIEYPPFAPGYLALGEKEARLRGLPPKYGAIVVRGAGGLRSGDFIFGSDGREFTDAENLQNAVLAKDASDTITLQIVRDGEEMEVEISL